MIHVGALPGSPRGGESIEAIVRRAAEEAAMLRQAGIDALMIENMHDRPYIHGAHGPETVAAMVRVGLAVREAAPNLPLGVQVLSGGNREALAIALAVGGEGGVGGGSGGGVGGGVGGFIRCENFVFSHVADEGLLPTAEAGPLLRYRRAIGAEHILILADIKKKHASHAITADVPIGAMAEAAEFFGADGVIVTGTATGRAADLSDLESARGATTLPVLVGSGVSADNIAAMLAGADAVIIGSWFKRDGVWHNPPDPDRLAELIKAANKARGE
jgi:hypothetical protein